jgi:hypothetical protein
VQHEAALGLDGAAKENGPLCQVVALQREVDLLEQVAQVDVDRPVDDQPQRPLVVVFAHVDHRAGKIAVLHARHGNEKLVGQIDGGSSVFRHASNFRRPASTAHR